MPSSPPMNSQPSATGRPLGHTEPRLWTPPLRELTPDTTYGYDLIRFAELIGVPFDPWEQWLALHVGELLESGVPRFRIVLIIVARQNGKTVFTRVLILFWMFVDRAPLIVATNTRRDTAKESWREVIAMAERVELLAADLPAVHTREAIGEEKFFNNLGSVYKFAAPNASAGRGDVVHRALIDELRMHKTRDVWDALIPAGNAVPDFQAFAISNQADLTGTVMNEVRTAALSYIDTGHGDPRLGLMEWSCPPGSDPVDPYALAYANPNLGHRIDVDTLVGQAIQAVSAGGETLARFKTEIMCIKVDLLDPAIEPELWKRCATTSPIDIAQHRRQVTLCFDVALDGTHATLCAAATIDGITYVEVIRRWQGIGCTRALRAELPDIVTKIKPRVVSWFPAGPAAAVAADLRQRRGNRVWPPRGVKIEELTAEISAVCMGLADVVTADELRHPDDPMLNQHVGQTQKLTSPNGSWVFVRSDERPVDGTYAAAGSVHSARTLPPPLKPLSGSQDDA